MPGTIHFIFTVLLNPVLIYSALCIMIGIIIIMHVRYARAKVELHESEAKLEMAMGMWRNEFYNSKLLNTMSTTLKAELKALQSPKEKTT